MTRSWLLGLLAIFLGVSVHAAEPPAWKELFDGHSLVGWEGNEQVFRVEQGAIVGGNLATKLDHNEFLATRAAFGDFELRLKFKVRGEKVNAGIQFRSHRLPGGPHVSGFQADLGEGYWGSLYDESRRNKTLARPDAEAVKKVLRPGDWNEYVIRAQGPHIQLWINGLQTVDYKETDPAIAPRGIIALQIHAGPPAEAWYKDIEIRELPN